jgi:DNA-directed RNA polymerase subunit H (RpoH/RPB5)
MATSQNTSNLISSIYNSRNVVLELMDNQGYDVRDYAKFSVNEVKSMKQNNQLDMLLEEKETEKEKQTEGSDLPATASPKKRKIYIRYFLGKSIRPNDLDNIIDDLFVLEEVLNKSDTLFIIVKNDINETLTSKLVHLWETDKIFVVMVSIKRLQFNILKHVLVPKHIVISEEEEKKVMKRFNISDKTEFPDISRFDPVAQAIGLRPGNVVKIERPSKTAIISEYYRVCV